MSHANIVIPADEFKAKCLISRTRFYIIKHIESDWNMYLANF